MRLELELTPIFPIENWHMHYENLIYSILSRLPSDPARITLGTPRGLSKTLMFAKDRSWEKIAFTENPEYSGWGKKAPSPVRKEIYTFFFDKLQNLGVSAHESVFLTQVQVLCSCILRNVVSSHV